MAFPGITDRCLGDLTALEESQAAAIVEKFMELRSKAPESGEPIAGLLQRPCKSLHAGRYRAVTWYDRDTDIVWLLAAGIHRDDSREDAYNVAGALEQSGRLYPTEADDAIIKAEAQLQKLKEAAYALGALRDTLLASGDESVHAFSAPDGISVRIWIERADGLELVVVCFNRQKANGQWLADEEIDVLSVIALGDRRQLRFELGHPFQCYESYIDPPLLPSWR